MDVEQHQSTVNVLFKDNLGAINGEKSNNALSNCLRHVDVKFLYARERLKYYYTTEAYRQQGAANQYTNNEVRLSLIA